MVPAVGEIEIFESHDRNEKILSQRLNQGGCQHRRYEEAYQRHDPYNRASDVLS